MVGIANVRTQPGNFSPGELINNNGLKLFGGLINSGLLSEQAKRKISDLSFGTGVDSAGKDFGIFFLSIAALPFAIEAGIAASPAVSQLVAEVDAIIFELGNFTSVRGGALVRTQLNGLKNYLLREGIKVFRKYGSKGLREFLRKKGVKTIVRNLQKADVGNIVNSKKLKPLIRTVRTIFRFLE